MTHYLNVRKKYHSINEVRSAAARRQREYYRRKKEQQHAKRLVPMNIDKTYQLIPEEGVCCLCGKNFKHYGNNPEPLKDFDYGRCCDACNYDKVIPARIKHIQASFKKHSL